MASLRSRYRSRIRQSARHGIEVTAEVGPAAVDALTTLDDEMSTRTGLRPFGRDLVDAICRRWCREGEGGTALVARHQGELLAAILVVGYRSTADMFMMPASRRLGNVSTSHLLLWEAMLWAKTHGYSEFDLGGYGLSAQPGDPLAGSTVQTGLRPRPAGAQVRGRARAGELAAARRRRTRRKTPAGTPTRPARPYRRAHAPPGLERRILDSLVHCAIVRYDILSTGSALREPGADRPYR